jgi:magnesium transporter
MKNSLGSVSKTLTRTYLDRYPAEFVRELESLPLDGIKEVLQAITPREAIRVWERLSPGISIDVLQSIDRNAALRVLNLIGPNNGAAILGNLDGESRNAYLAQVTPAVRSDLERALSHPPDSAGRLMGTRIDHYTPDMTVRQTLDKLRARKRPNVRVLFLVNEDRVLQGMVQIQDLALSRRSTRLQDLQRNIPAFVELTATKEEIVDKFEQFRVTELPVLDINGALMGIVRHHTLIDVAKQESSLDIQTMVGVSKDERALSNVSFVVRKRLPWLQINLATAFLAATVVGIFEDTIARVTALAVLLPVVAGQSGNTGAQALAVTMRGLALREVWPRQWSRIVFKELSAGFWNGIAVALTTAIGVYLWSRSPGLCLVIGVSMVVSMIIASVSGAAIPILLVKAGQDPATSSSIFLTTVTDVMGFFSFLGIATLMMGLL